MLVIIRSNNSGIRFTARRRGMLANNGTDTAAAAVAAADARGGDGLSSYSVHKGPKPLQAHYIILNIMAQNTNKQTQKPR